MIDQKLIEACVAEIVATKPESVSAIAKLLQGMLPAGKDTAQTYDLTPGRYYVAIWRRMLEIDPDHVAKDMLSGMPTLSDLEIDHYARRLIRAPQNWRAAHKVSGALSLPDKFLVMDRVAELKEGSTKTAGVVPFELKELS